MLGGDDAGKRFRGGGPDDRVGVAGERHHAIRESLTGAASNDVERDRFAGGLKRVEHRDERVESFVVDRPTEYGSDAGDGLLRRGLQGGKQIGHGLGTFHVPERIGGRQHDLGLARRERRTDERGSARVLQSSQHGDDFGSTQGIHSLGLRLPPIDVNRRQFLRAKERGVAIRDIGVVDGLQEFRQGCRADDVGEHRQGCGTRRKATGRIGVLHHLTADLLRCSARTVCAEAFRVLEQEARGVVRRVDVAVLRCGGGECRGRVRAGNARQRAKHRADERRVGLASQLQQAGVGDGCVELSERLDDGDARRTPGAVERGQQCGRCRWRSHCEHELSGRFDHLLVRKQRYGGLDGDIASDEAELAEEERAHLDVGDGAHRGGEAAFGKQPLRFERLAGVGGDRVEREAHGRVLAGTGGFELLHDGPEAFVAEAEEFLGELVPFGGASSGELRQDVGHLGGEQTDVLAASRLGRNRRHERQHEEDHQEKASHGSSVSAGHDR